MQQTILLHTLTKSLMEIKKLEFNPKTNKWCLLINKDNQELYLNEETIVRFELIQGKKITSEQHDEILKYDAIQQFYGYALHFLNRRRTTFEVEVFLTKKKEATFEEAQSVIQMLTSQKYLNDFEYAKASIHDQIHFHKKSFLAARATLKTKGIFDSNLLDEIQHWYDSNEVLQAVEYENLKILINQLEKSHKQYNNYERNQRIIAKLNQKGYNKDTIKQLLSTNETVIMNQNEKRKLLEKHRRRVFKAKNSYEYVSYMRKYNIDKDDLITFFNHERMKQND